MQISLGRSVVDMVTGFTGTVTARCEYLHINAQALVESMDKSGAPVSQWFDEHRLEVI